MRDKIIDRIKEIKREEKDFSSEYWKHIFVSINSNNIHLSSVDFNKVDQDELLRLFEYIVLTRDDISQKRVDDYYFKK